MNDKVELLWRLAVAVEAAERQDSTERAQGLRIQFNRQLAGLSAGLHDRCSPRE